MTVQYFDPHPNISTNQKGIERTKLPNERLISRTFCFWRIPELIQNWEYQKSSGDFQWFQVNNSNFSNNKSKKNRASSINVRKVRAYRLKVWKYRTSPIIKYVGRFRILLEIIENFSFGIFREFFKNKIFPYIFKIRFAPCTAQREPQGSFTFTCTLPP